MRKIVLMISISLDGYFETLDRGIEWGRVDEELHLHFNQVLAQMGGYLNGRRTHELMVAYWPTADQDPQASPAVAEYAGIWRQMPKVLFSRTVTHADWNTTVRSEVDPEVIRALKEQPGGDLVVGGPDLARTFLRHNLIDEFRLYVHPVALGQGRPLFSDPVDLELIETRPFPNGVVLLRYRPTLP